MQRCSRSRNRAYIERRTGGVSLAQPARQALLSCASVFGLRFSTSSLIRAHAHSIGLRSGEFAAHSSFTKKSEQTSKKFYSIHHQCAILVSRIGRKHCATRGSSTRIFRFLRDLELCHTQCPIQRSHSRTAWKSSEKQITLIVKVDFVFKWYMGRLPCFAVQVLWEESPKHGKL